MNGRDLVTSGNTPTTSWRRVPEYEKQRLARIAENKATIEALGLPKMASSLMGPTQNLRNMKNKGKAKFLEDDEDYRPSFFFFLNISKMAFEVSDELLGTFVPVLIYWAYSGIYVLMDNFEMYRLHTKKDEDEKNLVSKRTVNLVSKRTVVKGVLLQQTVQAIVAIILFKVSFGTLGLSGGIILLSYGFGAYFNILPGSEWSAIMLTYGFPLAIIGMAFKGMRCESSKLSWVFASPVPCLTYLDAQKLRETSATPILIQRFGLLLIWTIWLAFTRAWRDCVG